MTIRIQTAAKYHTSKLREFSDLEGVDTFGFRGEALSSLCALSKMCIVTKHESAVVGTKLELNDRGEIMKRTACPRQTGTTVSMSNLFETLPVRRREFQRNIKKEFIKMCQIMQGYGLIAYGCRIIVTNQPSKGAKMTVMSTNGTQSMLDNIVAIFGSKQKCDLLEIRQPIEPDEQLTQEIIKSLDTSIDIRDEDVDSLGLHRFKFEGYISSCTHGSGRSSRDRQFIFINGRPCEPKQVIKIINDTYHRFNVQQSPFVALNMIVERSEVDVNLTPDKRQVLVNNEMILRLALKKSLLSTFGVVPSMLKMQNPMNEHFKFECSDQNELSMEVGGDDDESNASSEDHFEKKICTQVGDSTKFASMLSQWRATGKTDEPAKQGKRKRPTIDEIAVRSMKMKKIHEYLTQDVKDEEKEKFDYASEIDSDDEPSDDKVNETSEKSINTDDEEGERSFHIVCKVKAIDATPKLKVERFLPANIDESYSPKRVAVVQATDLASDDTDVMAINSDSSQEVITISTTISAISELMQCEIEAKEQSELRASLNRMRFKAKIDPTKNKIAEQELSTEISKEDFVKMELIGQFNLGFLIVRLDDDLFIIDQHATDEKFNFETLQKTTCLQHQPLVVPQTLELTAVNEMIIIDNLPIFEMNGFKFDIDLERPVTKRIKLVAKPFSKNWEFGRDDIDELVFMLQEGDGNTSNMDSCRPSRVRAMFASRACRSSVMVGTSLSKPDMRRLVDQMGTIDQPWVRVWIVIGFRIIFFPFCLFSELSARSTDHSSFIESGNAETEIQWK